MRTCALITGAAKNTGPVIAEEFAKHSIPVCVTSRRAQEAEAVAAHLQQVHGVEACGLAFDQGDTDTIIPMFDALAARGWVVEMLVMNAAAQGLAMDPRTVAGDEWAAVIHTNVVGGFLTAREAANRMIAAKVRGSILFIGSNTCERAILKRSAYIASKGALSGLARSLALDYGRDGIRVNTLMPGPIHTDRWDALDEETVTRRRARAPLGREATAQDIAHAVYFLSTPLSANTTGAQLIIDGGMSVQLYPGL